MDTIKTAVVVALLLAVLYGVYTVLNKETAPPPADVATITEQEDLLAPPDIELGLDEGGPAADLGVDSDSGDEADGHASADADEPSIYAEVPATDGHASPPSYDLAASNANPRVQVNVEPLRSTVPPPTSLPPSDPTSSNVPPPDATLRLDTEATHGSAYTDSPKSLPPVGSTPPTGTSSVYSRGHANANTEPAPEESAAPGSGTEAMDNVAQESPSTNGESAGAVGSGRSPSNQTRLAPNRFADVKRQADQQIADRDYRGALTTLSAVYGEPTLTPEEQQQLLAMLDPLAGKVIYSREHLLEPAYVVRSGESLPAIAEQHGVPWQLLHNINRASIPNPDVLLPGTELKMVRGPFRAEVNLAGAELTLFLDQLYAGRFPVMVGNEPNPAPGDYAVQDKQEGRTYYAQDGRTIPPTAAENPYGAVWLDLGVNNLSIHGSAARDGAPSGAGCIGLSPRDARDVYGILSQGSRVTIYR